MEKPVNTIIKSFFKCIFFLVTSYQTRVFHNYVKQLKKICRKNKQIYKRCWNDHITLMGDGIAYSYIANSILSSIYIFYYFFAERNKSYN